MTQNQESAPKKAVFSFDPSFISETVSGIGLTLWVLYTAVEGGRLDPYFTVEVALVLYAAFMFSLFYKNYTDKKLSLAVLKTEQQTKLSELQAQLSAQQGETFTREVQARSSIRDEVENIRRYAYETVIQMIEGTLQDPSLSKERKQAYAEILNRVQDMQRSLWGSYEHIVFGARTMMDRTRQQTGQSRPPSP